MITVRLVQNKLFTCVRCAAVSNNTVNKAFSFLLCIYMDVSANISYSGAINTATLGILSILANYYFRTCCWLQLFLFIYLFLLEFVIFPGNKAQFSCLTIITRNSVNCWWNLDSGTGDSDSTHLVTWPEKSSLSNFKLQSFFFHKNCVIYHCDIKGNNLNWSSALTCENSVRKKTHKNSTHVLI